MDNFLNRIQGALVGGAVGDAVGFIIEKRTYAEAQEFSTRLLKSQEFSISSRTYPETYVRGQVSDDTQFSLLLIESYLSNTSFIEDLARQYQSGKLVGLGKGTNRVLKHYVQTKILPVELITNLSNGSVMRAWPVGICFAEAELESQTRLHGDLTHKTPEAQAAALFVARVMHKILNSKKLTEAELLALAPDLLKPSLMEALGVPELAIYLKSPSPALADWEHIPPLAIPSALASVITFFRNQDRPFVNQLAYGLALGGDTDTVCSVASALWGAKHGEQQIPGFLKELIQDQGKLLYAPLMELAQRIKVYR